MHRILVAGGRLWQGAVLLDETEEDGSGMVSVEMLKSGKRELVSTDRIRTWDTSLRDTPHCLETHGHQPQRRGAGSPVGRVVNVRHAACDV